MSTTETLQFQAESRQLLELMIHSVYSNKEIFLRELISNASDALDKLRLAAIKDPKFLKKGEQLEIRLEVNKDSRQLIIKDNGIGMSRQEVIENIGTIAKSGTRELLQQMKEKKDKNNLDLIGQFGVGFYSVFMVADKVTLLTRKAGENSATMWESEGKGEYSIADAEKPENGTTITLHLKPADTEDGLQDYTAYYQIENVVKKYSDFISYPIVLREEITKKETDKDGKEVEGGKTTTEIKDRTLNSMQPIWTRPANQVKDKEYQEFYRHISHDWNDPLKHIPFKAEGTLEYTALLYLPSKAPFDLYYQGYKSGLQLYVRRVLIEEHFEDLLPQYLRFVKGVVESSDLPLNLSREMLQEDRKIQVMRKNISKKVLSTLAEMKEKDNKKYLEFWSNFGNALKEGVSSDFENKDKITELLLFQSTAHESKLTDLAEYIKRMKKDQETVYYITGESRSLLENSPQLEAFKAKDIEVLLLTDPIDELVIGAIPEFQGKKLHNVSQGKIDLGSEEEKTKKELDLKEKEQTFKGLLEALQDKLKDQIKEVRLSSRLVSAPACVVGDEGQMSAHMERILKAANMGANVPGSKRVLELNPNHSIITKLQSRFDQDKKDPQIGEYAELLYGYAILAEGSELPDPVRFNQLMVKLMDQAV